jgi:hypothetical protein
LRDDRELRPGVCKSRCQQGPPNAAAGAQEGDKSQGYQQPTEPVCGPVSVAIRPGEGNGDRCCRMPGGVLVACRRCVRQKPIHINLARRRLAGGELIDAGSGRDRGWRDLPGGIRQADGNGVEDLDRGRGLRWLGWLRRRGVHQLRVRILDRLRSARRRLGLLRSGNAPTYGITTNKLPGHGVFRRLEPAFAVAIEAIDPVLAGNGRSRLPQAAL